MGKVIQKKDKCFISIPRDKEFENVREIIREVFTNLDFSIVFSSEVSRTISRSAEKILQEISTSEIIVAEVSTNNPAVFYEFGLAEAFGKPILVLVKDDILPAQIPIENNLVLSYKNTPSGMNNFKKELNYILKEFRGAPNKFLYRKNHTLTSKEIPYFIDLEKLEAREYENLCFELISQMGFRRVEWGKELREVDLVATLPKKDPDGFEYQELWFISLGIREESYLFLQRTLREPDYAINRLLKISQADLFTKNQQRYEAPFTVLFLTAKSDLNNDFFGDEIRRFNRRIPERNFSSSVRVRFWDEDYLTSLIQRYPQIAFKYFSNEARIRSVSRKSFEQLYEENVDLTKELLTVRNNLLEEKKKRFVAERNAAWKDVAFKAAHKLGNPIDAVDTFLQSLKKRLNQSSLDEAKDIAETMDSSIEEAKGVISQFKSLTRSQEIVLKKTRIKSIIEQATKFASEKGVHVKLDQLEDIPNIMLDPNRITECFNELIANSLHWLVKQEKKIEITIKRVPKRELPTLLDDTVKYIKIVYSDNGSGVSVENKDKIFAPFFTTYPHGTGLGLSMVKTIIEGHGGIVYENGIPGEGARFEIFLPNIHNNKGRI